METEVLQEPTSRPYHEQDKLSLLFSLHSVHSSNSIQSTRLILFSPLLSLYSVHSSHSIL
jgi:hypothetical protein